MQYITDQTNNWFEDAPLSELKEALTELDQKDNCSQEDSILRNMLINTIELREEYESQKGT
jgi:hypothetical protein